MAAIWRTQKAARCFFAAAAIFATAQHERYALFLHRFFLIYHCHALVTYASQLGFSLMNNGHLGG